MKFIPYTNETFHLPYKNLGEIRKDFFDVSIQESEGVFLLLASVSLGNVDYCIFTEGKKSEEEAIAEFNEVLESFYIPKFKKKYSRERL